MSRTARTPSRQLPPLLLLLGASVLACGEPASVAPELSPSFAKSAPLQDIPVVSILAGLGSVQSDGFGSYVNSNSLESEIQPAGDWVLDQTLAGSTRATRLDLSQVQSGTVPFTSPLTAKARLIAKSSQLGTTFRSMTGGQVTQTPLSIAFSIGSTSYGLRMNTANHSQTGYARLECVAPTDPTAPCSTWRVTPHPNADGTAGRTLARLERVDKRGATWLADVYLTYEIVVQR